MDASASAALARLADRVRAAHAGGEALQIEGGGSKAFLGNAGAGEPLPTAGIRGITRLEPTELVASALAGTPLAELEAALAEHGQCLAFEPPRFSPATTVGGMVAAGLSGPARAACGAVRDFVLGASLVNGRGELLHFGGQVMKNVAGFDVSRLLAGSFGTLGVLCEVTFKLAPLPAARAHLAFDLPQAAAIDRINRWGGEPLPIRASAWHEGRLYVQLAGAQAAVRSACASLGGEALDEGAGAALWDSLRDQRHAFFEHAGRQIALADAQAPGARPAPPAPILWRLCVPPTTAPLELDGPPLIEWGGGQRWFLSREGAQRVRAVAIAAGGHATAFRRPASPGADAGEVFSPLEPAVERIHRRLKAAFDPARVFNRGRMYPWL
jgi:glycolate oxidase FAD binding subunit